MIFIDINCLNMAKKKKVTKEAEIVKDIEQDVVSFDTQKSDVEHFEPIDMSEDIEQIKKEVFEEPIKIDDEKVDDNIQKKENKIKSTLNRMFGFVWNGMEYD